MKRGRKKMPREKIKVHKTLRFDPTILFELKQISKISGIPFTTLVERSIRVHLPKYKDMYPEYKYIKLQNKGRDERSKLERITV